jgi:hypothetical protein
MYVAEDRRHATHAKQLNFSADADTKAPPNEGGE